MLIHLLAFGLLGVGSRYFLKPPINIQKSIISYFPYNIIHSFYYFGFKYLPYIKAAKNKIDLSQIYSVKLDSKTKKPLLVVLIIGESMRGDMISLNNNHVNNMPNLSNMPDIISFNDAKASSTATRISIPYMLTRAIPPNFANTISESSIISIFKSLGFATSWIGNQGAFGTYETAYASIVMEANYVIIQPQIKKLYSDNKTYDEYLLQFIKQRTNEVTGNHFMVIHLLGSHWKFYERYPKSFAEKFKPSCKNPTPSQCSKEELLNAYNNSILYTDNVLSQIFEILNSYNSFVIYASDYGWSLGEDNLYGNGYLEDPIPKEQLNIAMFTWASKNFLESYRVNYKNILDKKFNSISHDYIFHSLLGCINVKSELIEHKFNLCAELHKPNILQRN